MITAFETSVSVQTGGSAVTIGLLRSVSELRMDSEMLDVTTLDAPGGWRRYARGARDGGEVTLEGFLDKEESGQETLRSLYLDSAPAAFTMPWVPALVVWITRFPRTMPGRMEHGEFPRSHPSILIPCRSPTRIHSASFSRQARVSSMLPTGRTSLAPCAYR